jgi:hypothetical protein
MSKKKLGVILKEKGYLNQSQLETALDIQKDMGKQALTRQPKVGQLLVAMQSISEAQLEEGLTEQASAPSGKAASKKAKK